MWVLDSVDTFYVKICSTTKSSRNEVLKTALSHLLLKTSFKCEFKAAHQSSLKNHNMSVHESIKYPCNQCESKFTQKGDLKKHIMSVHENVKYPCDQCAFKAAKKAISKDIKCLYM